MNGELLYILKHRDDNVGLLSIDDVLGTVMNYKGINSELSPYLGSMDLQKAKKWWQTRAIPGSRNMIDKILRNAECSSTYDYLAKNLGLSLTDSYWICPADSNLKWKDVCLYNILGSESYIPYHNATSYDPNASLGGQMEKYWDMSGSSPALVKTATGYYGQQAANEEFATILHSMQDSGFLYARYYTQNREVDNALQSVCTAFTSEMVEFVPALEIVDSQKQANDIPVYDHLANVCGKFGLDTVHMRKFLDYQTLTDFLLTNTDEHLLNFGVLRAAHTLNFVSEAPIFDSGNSMFYSEPKHNPLSRNEILSLEITATHKSEEKMLKSVIYKDVIKTDCLPSPQNVKDFYSMRGIPEKEAEVISKNYEIKAMMLNEFIQGKTISLYNEKHKGSGRRL